MKKQIILALFLGSLFGAFSQSAGAFFHRAMAQVVSWINLAGTISGTPTTYGCTAGSACYDDNLINITSDTQTAGSSTVGPSGLGINHVMGAGFTGAATGISNYFSIAGTSGNTSEDYVGQLNIATSNVPDTLGALFGGNDNVFLNNGATGWHQLIGREISAAAVTGSSVQDKYNLQLVLPGTDAVFGSHANIMLSLNSASSPLGADCGICFGSYAGNFPFNANSTIIGGWPHATARNSSGGSVPSGAVGTTLNGVDFSAITFTGSAFKSNGFNVDPSGNVTGGGLAITPGQQMVGSSNSTVITSGATINYAVGCGISANQNCQGVVPYKAKIKNLTVYTASAPGGAQTYTATLVTGAKGMLSATTVTCTISGASAVQCTDSADSATLAAGTFWSVQIVGSVGANSSGSVGFGFEMDASL